MSTEPTSQPTDEPTVQPADEPMVQPTDQPTAEIVDDEPGYVAPTEPIIPMTPTPLPDRRFRTGPSIPTVLWGVIAGLVAAAAITHEVSDVDLNLGIVAPLVLLAAGVVLVVWGIAGFGRPRRT
jgi:hypothetical protein